MLIRILFSLTLSLAYCLQTNIIEAKTVSNLGRVKENILHQEGLDFYLDQMSAIPRKAPFGVLPDGVDIDFFLQWISPRGR